MEHKHTKHNAKLVDVPEAARTNTDHNHIQLNADAMSTFEAHPDAARQNGITATGDGSLDNYNGVKVGENVFINGIEGSWNLKTVTPNTADNKTQFLFTLAK